MDNEKLSIDWTTLKTGSYIVTSVIYDKGVLCGFVIHDTGQKSAKFENILMGLNADHMLLIEDDAKALVARGVIRDLCLDSADDIRVKENEKSWRMRQPAIELQHCELAMKNESVVLGVPTAFSSKGLLNMLLYGRDLKPYFGMLLHKGVIDAKESYYGGYDMAVIRNVRPQHLTHDLVTGEYKMLVNTSFFQYHMEFAWYNRPLGTIPDLGKAAMSRQAGKKLLSVTKDMFDTITDINLQALCDNA